MLWAVWLGLEKSDQESALQEVRHCSINLFLFSFPIGSSLSGVSQWQAWFMLSNFLIFWGNFIRCNFILSGYNGIVKSIIPEKGDKEMDEFYISPKDREVLRELAKKQLELSQAEKNKKRIGE